MVDIVHHSVIGFGGALVAQQLGNVDAAVGFLIGSLLPDLDVVFMALGKSRYLRLHQSITHSVFVLPFLAMWVGSLLAFGLDASWIVVALACFLGSLVHIAFDMLNSFGVRATWPSPRRYSVDAFFFVDIYVFAASGLAVWALWSEFPALPVCLAWFSFLATYSSLKVWWRSKVVCESGAATAIPSGVSPLFYYLTRDASGAGVQVGHSRGFRRKIVWEGVTPHVADEVMAVLRAGPMFKDLEEALKLFRPISFEVDAKGDVTSVVSRCVAVRNFKNRYGEITSTLVDGKLVDEVAFL
ncbi:metal-dependent hydrolase [Rhizobium sp. MHM7A]|uniref:metal-dependent hydrolase n=1 Tax=Rhizobium sp. MHM7A TaxID=2583233 RepID=UPI001106416A|nr:metal-dependent hydrolase [Rhizobium sp. MHM7A]TLX15940.1 metal-dependent hydrolase [Rhizobium sp. MHM7A]